MSIKIEHITSGQKRRWNNLAELFDKRVVDGTINPRLIEEIGYVPESGGLIVAMENGIFRGVLHYRTHGSLNEIERRYREYPSLEGALGFREYDGKGSLAHLAGIETFKKEQGIGTRLVDSLKSAEGISGIFLDSVLRSEDFFEKMHFRSTGLRIEDRSLMVWMRSRRY